MTLPDGPEFRIIGDDLGAGRPLVDRQEVVARHGSEGSGRSRGERVRHHRRGSSPEGTPDALPPAPEPHPAGEISAFKASRTGIGGRPIRRPSVGSTRVNPPCRAATNRNL